MVNISGLRHCLSNNGIYTSFWFIVKPNRNLKIVFLPFVDTLQEKFEDTKSKKDRQHNDKKKKDKRINNDLQNITQKTKDRVTRNPLKTEGNVYVLLHKWHPSCYSCKGRFNSHLYCIASKITTFPSKMLLMV